MTLVEIPLQFLLESIRWCGGVVLLLGTFVHLCLWLVGRRVVRPRLYFKPSSLSRHLQRHMSALERPFTVPRLLTSRHLQTLLGPLAAAAGASAPPLLYRRQYLQLRDRCSVPLDWAEPLGGGTAELGARVLLVLPDLLLDDSRLYAPVCRRALAAGCLPVVVNFRQLVRKNLPATRVAALYDVTDLRWIVRYLRAVCPGRRLTAIGFGNGGSLLLAYLGEHGISCLLTAAAVVSPAWGCAAHLLGDACAPYDAVTTLREKYRLCRRATDASTAADATFADFHRRVHGDDEERHNPIIDIDEVSVPLLAVHADDDPVYGATDLPLQLFTAFPHLFLLRSPLGGHCGFYTGGGGGSSGGGGGGGGSSGGGGVSWAADTAVQFIDCVCAFLDAEDAGGAGGMARAARRVVARVARRSAAAALKIKNAGRTSGSGGHTPEGASRTPERAVRTPENAVRSPDDSGKPLDSGDAAMKSGDREISEVGENCELTETRRTSEHTPEGSDSVIAENSGVLLEDAAKAPATGAGRCAACGKVMCPSSEDASAGGNAEVHDAADTVCGVDHRSADGETVCDASCVSSGGEGEKETNCEIGTASEISKRDEVGVADGLSCGGSAPCVESPYPEDYQCKASINGELPGTLLQVPEHVGVNGNGVGH